MFYLDQKITVWQRVYFNSEEEMNEAIKKIEEGNDYNINDVCNDFELCQDNLFETETILNPEDNNGFSTIEVYKNDELIYENGNKN